jgi:catecholate siderophore receptor
MDRLLYLLATAAAVGATPAHAEDPAASAGPEIVVTGQRSEYGVKATTTATKTATPIRNVPQAMTVVTGAQIQDQQLRSVAELLNFVPGASTATRSTATCSSTTRASRCCRPRDG